MFTELAAHLGRAIVAPDLPGHGGSASVLVTMKSAVEGVLAVIEEVGPPVGLLGYSMGGRVALQLTLDRPELVDRLVLVSTSAGIVDSADRERRRQQDEQLAAQLERDGIAPFLDRWLAEPMFAGLAERGPDWQAADRERRERNTAAGLAASLRGLGQGTTPPVLDRLGELSIPVLVMVGALDKRYVAEAERIAGAIDGAQTGILAGVGHAVVGEDPGALADELRRFLGS